MDYHWLRRSESYAPKDVLVAHRVGRELLEEALRTKRRNTLTED